MRARLATPVVLAVACVSVLFDAGVAVPGDGHGQNTYTNAHASDDQLTVKARS